jgi:hypothetical protein
VAQQGLLGDSAMEAKMQRTRSNHTRTLLLG